VDVIKCDDISGDNTHEVCTYNLINNVNDYSISEINTKFIDYSIDCEDSMSIFQSVELEDNSVNKEFDVNFTNNIDKICDSHTGDLVSDVHNVPIDVKDDNNTIVVKDDNNLDFNNLIHFNYSIYDNNNFNISMSLDLSFVDFFFLVLILLLLLKPLWLNYSLNLFILLSTKDNLFNDALDNVLVFDDGG